ncbi:hypothetical protein O3M35_001538 [Rhynocoris fuscipes]|uniref:Exportin-2 central domain-containing protein n=1 Tax=Rhynocoris fuscipes TaxID=488301 RepID=A0AAW1CVD7_9HEMI
MRRDIEGADVETRRRAACDLVRVLAQHFDERVSLIFSQFVQVINSRQYLNSLTFISAVYYAKKHKFPLI